jgi:hypothetical protein
MRRVLSWVLYGFGDFISKPMMRSDRWSWLQPVYQRAMKLSSRVQGEGKGPWGPSSMQPPRKCDLWEHPERVAPRAWLERFDHMQTLEDTSHWWRYLLKCKECGQLYFHEFYEEMDIEDGDDPQFWTFIPVYTDQDVERLNGYDRSTLLEIYPRLHRDTPKGTKEPAIYWLKSPSDEAEPI